MPPASFSTSFNKLSKNGRWSALATLPTTQMGQMMRRADGVSTEDWISRTTRVTALWRSLADHRGETLAPMMCSWTRAAVAKMRVTRLSFVS